MAETGTEKPELWATVSTENWNPVLLLVKVTGTENPPALPNEATGTAKPELA
jgi:hypothetical protein